MRPPFWIFWRGHAVACRSCIGLHTNEFSGYSSPHFIFGTQRNANLLRVSLRFRCLAFACVWMEVNGTKSVVPYLEKFLSQSHERARIPPSSKWMNSTSFLTNLQLENGIQRTRSNSQSHIYDPRSRIWFLSLNNGNFGKVIFINNVGGGTLQILESIWLDRSGETLKCRVRSSKRSIRIRGRQRL